MPILKTFVILLAVVLLHGGCGDSGGSSSGNDGSGSDDTNTEGSTENQIIIGINAFISCTNAYSPAQLSVSVGTTVTWRNDDTTRHTVTSSDGVTCTTGDALPEAERTLDSGDIPPGGTFPFTFETAGTYFYVCSISGHLMQGTVIVTEN